MYKRNARYAELNLDTDSLNGGLDHWILCIEGSNVVRERNEKLGREVFVGNGF